MMKNIKLHQWYALLVCTTFFFTACSKKTFTLSNSHTEEKIESPVINDSAYIPPGVIIVPDDKAKTNKEDELYYDDEYGYRYWRYTDGKYYLDKKCNKYLLLKKKHSVKTSGI